MTELNAKPLVSVICLTYNHAPYIRECLDGFIMQETDFPFEVIIHDDASTDGTTEIVKEYAAKYPNIIKPIIQTENQYSKHHEFKRILKLCFNKCGGKYIAFCEGDDYWTDSTKLKKQALFLNSHPDVVYTCHRYEEQIDNQEYRILARNSYFTINKSEGFYFDIEYVLNVEFITKTLTCLFRAECINDIDYDYDLFRDVHLIVHILSKGKGYCFAFNGGTYRKQELGIWSQTDKDKRLLTNMKIWKDLSRKTNNKLVHKQFKICLTAYILLSRNKILLLKNIKFDMQTIKTIFCMPLLIFKSEIYNKEKRNNKGIKRIKRLYN